MVKEFPSGVSQPALRTVQFLVLEDATPERLEREVSLLGYSVFRAESIDSIILDADEEDENDSLLVVVGGTRKRKRLLSAVSVVVRSTRYPTILVTGSLPENDRLTALRVGITAILENTLSARELALRIGRIVSALSMKRETVLNRHGLFTLGEDELEIDEAAHKAYVNGDFLRLTETQWRVLHHLASRAQAIVARDALIHECMGYHEEEPYLRTLDAHIKNLRHKLGRPDWIETVRGYGYQFVGQVKQSL